MSQARLREALSAGGPTTTKERGPPVSDGTLTVTPDTPEAVEWRSRRSIIDSIASCSTYLDDEDDGGGRWSCSSASGNVCLIALAAVFDPSERCIAPRRCLPLTPSLPLPFQRLPTLGICTVDLPGKSISSATSTSGSSAATPLKSETTSGEIYDVGQGGRGTQPWELQCPVPGHAGGHVPTRSQGGVRPRRPSCDLHTASPCRYILVYPQGCDVANHLSLFLCVADYDKLLPGAVAAAVPRG